MNSPRMLLYVVVINVATYVETRKINYVPFKFSDYHLHSRIMFSVNCTIFQFAHDKIVPLIDLLVLHHNVFGKM